VALTNLREFPGLSHLAFQHPLDRQARAGLEQIPLLPDLMKKFSGAWAERVMRLYHIGCNLQVNARQYPSLYKQYVRIAQILDMQKLPELFVETSPVINAISFGLDNYSLTITSGLSCWQFWGMNWDMSNVITCFIRASGIC
jgi:hypothetical protein